MHRDSRAKRIKKTERKGKESKGKGRKRKERKGKERRNGETERKGTDKAAFELRQKYWWGTEEIRIKTS